MGGAGDRVLGAIHEAEVKVKCATDAKMGGRSQLALGDHSMGNELDEFFLSISESEQALFDVLDVLERASVDARERRIVWHDGTRLSIEDAARKIHSEAGASLDMVQSHVVAWLEMFYEPKGLDEDQMEEFEQLIELWIAPYDDTG